MELEKLAPYGKVEDLLNRKEAIKEYLLSPDKRQEMLRPFCNAQKVRGLVAFRPLVKDFIDDYMDGMSWYKLRRKYKQEYRFLKELEEALIDEYFRR